MRGLPKFSDSATTAIHTISNSQKNPEEQNSLEYIISAIRSKSALTAEKNAELFHQLRQLEKGNTKEDIIKAREIRNKIIEGNMMLVLKIVNTLVSSSTDKESHVDYIQQGALGLMRAVSDFDVNLGFAFSTYATNWIKQSIGRYIDDTMTTIRIPVHQRAAIRKILAAQHKIIAEDTHDKDITNIKRLSEITQLSESTILLTLTAMNLTNMTSAHSLVGDDNDTELQDFFTDDFNMEEDVLYNISISPLMEQLFDCLNQDEKVVINLRFGFDDEPKTLEEIAQLFETIRGKRLTRERIRQIEAKAMEKMIARTKKLRIEADDFIKY